MSGEDRTGSVKELLLQNDGDVERCGDGVSMWFDCGGINQYDREIV
jgi:hypothetical protein